MIYTYPALFEKEGDGFIVTFPDFEGPVTDGDTFGLAMDYAKDLLSLILVSREDNLQEIPVPSASSDIPMGKNAYCVRMVTVDTEEYRVFLARFDRMLKVLVKRFGLSDEEALSAWDSLHSFEPNNDIESEMLDAVLQPEFRFPTGNAVCVDGYTAEQVYNEYMLGPVACYQALALFRKDFGKALDVLDKYRIDGKKETKRLKAFTEKEFAEVRG